MAATVTVAYKGPTDLLLRLFEFVETRETTLGGERVVKQARVRTGSGDVPTTVRITGNSHEWGKSPRAPIVGGYALTYNVNAEFWTEWAKQNHDSDLLRYNLLFAASRTTDVEAKAKEYARTRSNLEPIDPAGDPRAPGRVTRSDEQRSAAA